jgi:hypothetical protein
MAAHALDEHDTSFRVACPTGPPLWDVDASGGNGAAVAVHPAGPPVSMNATWSPDTS